MTDLSLQVTKGHNGTLGMGNKIGFKIVSGIYSGVYDVGDLVWRV